MIITTKRHGRTARDTRNLKSHLGKGVGQISRVVAIGNVPLSNSDDAIRYMEAMRNGSRAEVAYHHITISPSKILDETQRDDAVQRILQAMDAEEHPFVLWEHAEKPRHGADVDQHFHLVLGHVGHDGKALNDGHSYSKLEAVARSVEVDFGEEITPSRRTAAVAVRLVEMGRGDVVQHLSIPTELPRSSMTSGMRAAADRQGVDLPASQAVVKAAWQACDTSQAFAHAIAEKGFTVAPGRKEGIFVVSADGVEIGALDRIVKEKRAIVAHRMEGFDNVERQPENTASYEKTRGNDLSRDAKASTIVDPPRSAGSSREWADRADQRLARNAGSRAETAALVDGRFAQQGRRFDEIQTVKNLSGIRVSSAVIEVAQDIRKKASSAEVTRFQARQVVDLIETSTGWERLQSLKNRLVDAIRTTADRVRAFRAPPEPSYSLRDQQIADVFRKAVHCSAENIERLEKLDPDLDRFRLYHGGETFQSMSRDQILAKLDDWREQVHHLTYDDDDDEYEGHYRPRFT